MKDMGKIWPHQKHNDMQSIVLISWDVLPDEWAIIWINQLFQQTLTRHVLNFPKET